MYISLSFVYPEKFNQPPFDKHSTEKYGKKLKNTADSAHFSLFHVSDLSLRDDLSLRVISSTSFSPWRDVYSWSWFKVQFLLVHEC